MAWAALPVRPPPGRLRRAAGSNQFLSFADVLRGGDTLKLYQQRRGGSLRLDDASLERDGRGRIVRLQGARTAARSGCGDGALVTAFERRARKHR